MNRISLLITICVLTLFSWSDVIGDSYTDTPAQEGAPERSWRVFGALTNHPDDSPLFIVDDIFHLQQKEGNTEADKRTVKFKTPKMKNGSWKKGDGSKRTLHFKRYPDADSTEYLCKIAKFKSETHIIVISRMAEQNPPQIAIQYDHVPDNYRGNHQDEENENEPLCEEVTLQSHGGLAHAHAVR